jgi:hypothetical protein
MKPLTILALVVILIIPAARPQTSFDFYNSSVGRDSVVEQQSPGGALCEVDCVVNPTDFCPWDPDEAVHVRGFGDLAPGDTVSWSSCVIADWSNHLVSLSAGGFRHGEITVTITAVNPHRGGTVTATGTSLRMCLLTPDYDRNTTLLSEIPGSNGGVGQHTPITVTVTNTGTRRIRDLSMHAGIQYSQIAQVREFYCGATLTCVGLTVPGLDPKVCWGVA